MAPALFATGAEPRAVWGAAFEAQEGCEKVSASVSCGACRPVSKDATVSVAVAYLCAQEDSLTYGHAHADSHEEGAVPHLHGASAVQRINCWASAVQRIYNGGLNRILMPALHAVATCLPCTHAKMGC